MKRSVIKMFVSAVLLCGLFACAGATHAEDEVYKISVTGGHAINSEGETITEARPWDVVYLIPDSEAGTYVKEWSSGQIDGYMFGQRAPKNSTSTGHWYYHFFMPRCDVTVSAVIAEQTPYVIDLTSGIFEVPKEDSESGWYDWLSQALGYNDEYVFFGQCEEGVDLDGDGIKDIRCVNPKNYVEWLYRVFVPMKGCSVHGTVTLDRENTGPYRPFVFELGDDPVKDRYTITVEGGHAEDLSGHVITEAEAGTYITLKGDSEGLTVKEWKTGDGSKIPGVDPGAYGGVLSEIIFPMPAKDMTYSATLEGERIYTVDMTKGYTKLPELDDDTWLWELFEYDSKRSDFVYRKDLNGDGIIDLCSSPWEFPLIFPVSGQSCGESFKLHGFQFGNYNTIEFRFPKTKDTYEIHVDGGHAEDEHGSVITSAKAGARVLIVSDGGPGQYWKSWSTDYDVIKGAPIRFLFTMPARDVTLTAQTVKTQTPMTLDLTHNSVKLSEEEIVRFENAMLSLYSARGAECNYGYNMLRFLFGFDLDGDGRDDIEMTFSEDYYIGNRTGLCRSGYYNLGTDFVTPIPDGSIGPIHVIVDNSKAEYPVADRKEEPHKITVIGGTAYYGSDTAISAAQKIEVGTQVYIRPTLEKGQYVKSWVTNLVGQETVTGDRYPIVIYFSMPPYDVTITAVTEEQKPFEVDMTSGKCNLSEQETSALWWYMAEAVGGSDFYYGVYKLDLNKDGKTDLIYEKTVETTPDAVALGDSFTFTARNAGPNWPITLKFSDVETRAIEAETELYGHPNTAVAVDINASYEKDGQQISVANPKSLREGAKIAISPVLKGVYELKEIYYLTKDGDRVDVTVDATSASAELIMPGDDLKLFIVLQDKAVSPTPSPTPVPTATPTPELTSEMTPTATAVPSDTPENVNGDDKSSSFNPLYLIPAVAALCAVMAAGAVLLKKKKAASAGGEEMPKEQTETSQTSEKLSGNDGK